MVGEPGLGTNTKQSRAFQLIQQTNGVQVQVVMCGNVVELVLNHLS